jgi:DNA polymerase II large subunit
MWYLRILKVKIKIHHKNHVPLKSGVAFIILNESSVDQEIALSLFKHPTRHYLTQARKLFKISKAWQKRLESTINPAPLALQHFENSEDFVIFCDSYDGINDHLMAQLIRYQYPMVLLSVDNARRVVDDQPLPRVVVDVYFHIPIVYEEYEGLSIKQIKLMLLERKEGNIYEYD